MISLLENVDGKIPDFEVIKYTNENFAGFLSCLHFQSKKYGLLLGSDENILTALVLGSKGTLGGTYNFRSCFTLAYISI